MVWRDSSEAIRRFVDEREWGQFHSPENLAKSVAIEAGELLECFQWSSDADEDQVRDELADVLIYSLLLAERMGVDVDEVIAQKLAGNAERYPVDLARGRSVKHDRL